TLPLAFFAFIVMLVIADDIVVRLGVAIFMISSMLLFGVSAVYHRGTWSDRVQGFWKRFDHANIFLLIAGSYTPFSLLLLSMEHRVTMLSLVWGGALLGVAFKIFWIGAPRWLYVPLYLLLGWAAVLYFPEFVDNSSTAVMALLIGGGVLYSLGALVYGFKWPNPSPTYFGFHEVFHAFTIAAFIVHYVGVSLLAYQQH
ncbi:MAG: DNA-binding protein, partial [Aeromicrobium sp.]|nr:DNA-binding protein [Aeromicrobium sp.]